MKRIFVAVDISDEARRRAAAHIDSLKSVVSKARVGWVRAEKLHLTLKFLGDTGENELARLNQAVERAAALIGPFHIRLGTTGVFPSPRKARVLWLGVEDADREFRRLYQILEVECEKEGFEPETKRDFKPHLTIARLREPGRPAELVRAHLETEFGPVEVEVPDIGIYESRLQPAGPVYLPFARYKLAG